MAARFRNSHFLVIGRAGLDLYADPPGTEIENAGMFSAALGGSAANIAVALCRQGGYAALLTTVSNDAVGRYTMKALTSYGVDVSHIQTVGGEARNSLAVVETRAENCQSVIYRNNAADFHLHEADAENINWKDFAAVIVTGTALAMEPSRSAVLKTMNAAKRSGLSLIIDIDYRPYSWASRAEAQDTCMMAAQMCGIIVGNDEEFAVLAGKGDGLALAREISKDRLVIYKRGPNGCATFERGKSFETPVFPVKALKPTGAGDGFMGGFIAGLVKGATVADAVRRGAATAAIVVTKVGCAPAMPSGEEVDHFMRNHIG
jgi:5-dehydro-2-deoxygluconokinase